MSDSIYPAEPPVDLRSARKITPPPVAPEQEFDEPTSPDTDTAQWSDASESAEPCRDEYWDEGGDFESPHASAVTTSAWREELLPTPPGVETDPAQWGRRGWFNTVTVGALKLRPLPDEVLHRKAVAAVGRPLMGQQLIMVANPKGGQAKTVTSLMLGNTFATHRRTSPPVVWDNNESEGTLGYRAASAVPATSVWDLLAHSHTLASPNAAASGLSRFLRAQPTGAEVLASDDSAERMDQIEGKDCERVYSVLRRWRELVIVDTGNNRRRENWLWTAHNAHLLVIPIIYALDSTVVVLKMIESLKRLGLEALVANAIVVCSPNPAGPDPKLHEEVRSILLEVGLRNFAEVPFDPALPRAGRIDYDRLSEDTRRAWVQVCAMAATVLAEAAQYREVELTVDDLTTSYVPDPSTGSAAQIADLDRYFEQMRRGPQPDQGYGAGRYLA